MGAYDSIQGRNNSLIREGLEGSVFIGDLTADEVTAANLFVPAPATPPAVAGDLASPMTIQGYTDLGWLSAAGAKFGRALKMNDVTVWGSDEPARSDVTSDVTTLVIEAYETKLRTIGLWTGVAASAITAGSNGSVEIKKPVGGSTQYYRILALAADETSNGEIVIAQFLPRARVTAITDQSYMQTGPVSYGVTLTAYEDPTLGYSVKYLYGGSGLPALSSAMGFSRTVTASTTSTSTTLTATTGTFSSADVGRHVSGAGIPAGTTISTFTDSTHVVMSAAATATATGVTVTIS